MKKKTQHVQKGAGTFIPSWIWFPLYNHGDKGWTDDKQQLGEAIVKGLQNFLPFEYFPEQIKHALTDKNEHDNCMMYGVNGDGLEKLLADIRNNSTMAQPADAADSKPV